MSDESSGFNSAGSEGGDGDLDDRIRTHLSSLVDRASEPGPFPAERLLADISDLSDPGRGKPAGRRGLIAVAAAIVIALVGVGAWINHISNRQFVTGDASCAPLFSTLEPGWHEVDPGPVPPMQETTLLSNGGRVLVAGIPIAQEDLEHPAVDEVRGPSGPQVTKIFAFDPLNHRWSELPSPPFVNTRVVAAGDQLVAVGRDGSTPGVAGYRWATLDMRNGECGRPSQMVYKSEPDWDLRHLRWEGRGEVAVSSELASLAGVGGLLRASVGGQLIATGDRVIDAGLGAVLDPSTGESMELALPPNIADFRHLLGSTPQWAGSGRRLIMTSWGKLPGLSWDSFGSEWSEIPGPSAAGEEADPDIFVETTAETRDGQVVLVATRVGKPALAGKFDPVTGVWTRLPDVPEASGPACGSHLASVGTELVVQPCPTSGPPLRLDGDRWVAIEAAPSPDDCCDSGSASIEETTWLSTGDALFTWSTRFEQETRGAPQIPHQQVAVWIPGRP